MGRGKSGQGGNDRTYDVEEGRFQAKNSRKRVLARASGATEGRGQRQEEGLGLLLCVVIAHFLFTAGGPNRPAGRLAPGLSNSRAKSSLEWVMSLGCA